MDKEVPLTDLTKFKLISKCAKLGSELKQLQSSQSEAAEFVEWIKETRPIHYNMWTGMIKRLKESKLKSDG